MRKLSFLRSERSLRKALKQEIARTRESYLWSFEYPSDWSEPVGTLYAGGWCLSRRGEAVRGIRARLRHRKFTGNYGILRPDVVHLHQLAEGLAKCGFAIALPLPNETTRVIFELQDAKGLWHPFAVREVVGSPNDNNSPPRDPKYFIPNPGVNPRIEFWLDRPSTWSKKIRYLRISGWCLTTSGPPIARIRARIRGRTFIARFGNVRPDIAALFQNRPGALRSGFILDVVVPRGPVRLILEAQSEGDPWETFFAHSIRGPFFLEEHDEAREIVGDYALWIRRYDRVRSRDVRDIREQIARLEYQPLISVLLPTYNSDPRWLRRAIGSVQRQLYHNWELCVADDASTKKILWPMLQRLPGLDRRIKVMRRDTNGHISAASNAALFLATGDFVALLDHDDELAWTALYFVALELNRDRSLQLIYSDEDKLDRQGRRADPYFKCDWNPELFLGQNYISHLGIYRTDLVRKVGGFREGFEGSQDYDLTLRCLEEIDARQICHIPRVLYHWRIAEESTADLPTAKPYAQEAARRAVQEHLDRRNVKAVVEPHYGVYLRAEYALPPDLPLVSIIIPTRDRGELLCKCLESIWAKTSYPNYEVIVLDNDSSEAETVSYLETLQSRAQVLRVEGPFNYSTLNNHGVNLARGAFVALLNNDLEVMSDSWLTELVRLGLQPQIGVVGARLWYPDGSLQHGGVILGAGGVANHAHAGLRHEHGYFARAHLTQNFSAVTAACALVKRDLYLELGGFDEVNLPVAFNDVDFCLRVIEAGYQVVWTPHAELYHHESASRGFDVAEDKLLRFLSESDYMYARWGDKLKNDPYYNPNLSLGEELFTLSFPPRLTKPWQKP